MKNTVLTVHPTISTSTATSTFVDLQHQLYLKMKVDLQTQVADLEIWDILKNKFEKSSASASSCRVHDVRQGDDGPPEGEKRAKIHKTSRVQNIDKDKRMYKINHRRVRDNLEEYFSDHKIVEVFRVTTDQQHELNYME
ncbi:hypothetical protein Tco_0872725 [Tanacetum coccineum]